MTSSTPIISTQENRPGCLASHPSVKMANSGSDQSIQTTPESPEVIAFATRMYDAARNGDLPIFQQALPAGLPANMTNDKGDTLVLIPHSHFMDG